MQKIQLFLVAVLCSLLGYGQNARLSAESATNAYMVFGQPEVLASRTAEGTLYSNGPYFNVPGTPNVSLLQDTSLGMDVYGAGHALSSGYRIADDWVVTETVSVGSIQFYAYQTGSSTTSTINHVSLRIWDGVPGEAGSNVVWGDATTNRFTSSTWSGAYRQIESAPGDTSRPIMITKVNTPGLTLAPGTYWLDWNCGGTLASGPWAPPIAILGQSTTGNAMQFDGTSWTSIEDTGSFTPYGFPFEVNDDSEVVLENLLVIDLSVENHVTITATTGASAVSASGNTSTGIYLEDFFASADAQAVSGTIVGAATLTATSVPTDGSPSIFRFATDPGLNIWGYSATSTTTFTEGAQAFSGEATWSISPLIYAAMLTAPNDGNIYFPADDISDISSGAMVLGTYSVVRPAGDSCDWTVTVFGSGYGDEVSWQFRGPDSSVLLSGGSYDFGYNDVQTVTTEGPVEFYIESEGTFNDNTPSFRIANGNGVIVNSSLSGGTSATFSDLLCSDDPIPVASNDECDDAIALSCGDSHTGNTNLAFNSGGNDAPDVFYSYTGAGEAQYVTVSLCGSSYDTYMRVFTDCTLSNQVAFNDDSCGLQSQVTFISDGTSTYYIMVEGFGLSAGDYVIELSCVDAPSAPINDDCADVTPTTLVNGTTSTFTGTTAGATGSVDEMNVLGYAAVWEAVTLTGSCNNMTIDYCGTDPGVMSGNMFIVYTDSCSATNFAIGSYDFTTCGDGNGTIRFYNLPAGTYYLPVIVDMDSNTLGAYTMNVLSVDCPPSPENDDCVDAIALSCGDNLNGTTTSANDSGGNPAGDVFYTYTGSGTPELVTVSLCGSSYDTYIRVFTDCTLSNQVAFNDDFCGFQSEVSFISDGTTTYIIMVEGFGNSFGDFVIGVTCVEAPDQPVNDDCDDAIALACGDSHSGNTTYANNSGGNSAGDVFYTYTGSGTPEVITASLCGSSYDTYIRVFTDCTLINEVATNDDFCGLQSEVSFISDGTTTYIIMVEGFGSSGGDYVINLTCDDVPPPPTDCEDFKVLSNNFEDGYFFGGDTNQRLAFDIPTADNGFTLYGIAPTVIGYATSFDFIFYEDAGGLPGTQITTRTGQIVAEEVTGSNFGYDFVKYTVAFDASIDLDANTTYWVEISSDALAWELSTVLSATLGHVDVFANANVGGLWTSTGGANFVFELVCNPLGIGEMNVFGLTYYPNPVKNYLTINSQKAIESISAFNLAGQKVLDNVSLTAGQLDMSHLSAGVYVFKVAFQGGAVETLKIVKE